MGTMEERFRSKQLKTKKKISNTKKQLEKSLESSTLWSMLIRTGLLILFYYITSIGLTFYQNWLLKKFYYPLSVVLVHFVVKFCLAGLCRQIYTWYTGLERITLGWSSFLSRVAIVALVASLDIGLSQWSLEYIQVALYTITKSTSIVFILFFAILFNLEKKHWSLIVIVLTISGGLIMFTYKSTDFSLIGVLMVLSASFLSGIRWTFSQLIMQKSKLGLHNPLDMVYHVQPLMILTLLPFVLVIEGVSIASSVAGFRYTNLSQLWETVSLVTAGGIIAFLMEVSEFMLVTFTSSLTLTIAGTVKEVISLALAVVFQTTELSPVNWLGMVVCLTGVGLHVFRKAVTMEGTEGVEARRKYRSKSGATTDISIPLLSSESDSSDEINHVTGHRPQPQDHNLLQDHRQWTSVRDNHIKAGLDSPDKDDFSALQEADQIINQLDLMNSSEEMS